MQNHGQHITPPEKSHTSDSGLTSTHGYKQYPNLDIIKYLAAICVVCIHLGCFIKTAEPYPNWFAIIIHTAVPFFFTCSGFLIGINAASKPDFSKYLFKKSLKFLKIWAIWILIYLPLDILAYQNYTHLSIDWIVNWFFYSIIHGQGILSWPLWYLFSMTIGCLIISLSCRKNIKIGTSCVVVITALIYISLNIIPTNQLPSILQIFKDLSYTYLTGAIFISSGIILSWIKFQHSDIRLLLIVAIAFIILGCVMYHYDIILNTLPRGIGLTMLAVTLPQIKFNTISVRQQSMWIFYIHMYCIGVLVSININTHPVFFFISSIMLSIITGALLTIITRLKSFYFLKILIS